MLRRAVGTRILWVAVFILVAFIGDRAGGMILSELLLSSQGRYSALYRGGMTKDVVFTGNSRGVHSFYAPAIAKAAGLSAFNISYNSLTPQLAAALFADYLEHNAIPKMVVIEVSMLAQDENRSALFTPYALQSANLAKLIRERNPESGTACRISHLYCFNSELFLRTLYYLNGSDQAWVNRYQMSDWLARATSEMDPFTLPILPGNFAALQRLIESAEAHGVTVKLVMAPYVPTYASNIQNLDSWIARVEAESGYPVLNYALAVEDLQGFADRQHLNKDGSLLFLEKMLVDGFFDLTPASTTARKHP